MATSRYKNSQSVSTYKDNLGNIITLGKELARGGEGRVCLVQDNPNVVAKIYLDKALNKHAKANKIKAMCALYDDDIAKFSALPQRAIINSQGKVVGFIMERISDFKEIHNLYGISTKRKFFDFADWGFMVHTAKNLAIAVAKLHRKNIVIGDINQGNILVNSQAMIKLIDCDSYQVECNGKYYLCEVGVLEYTSPELQGQSFNGIQRTKNHDCFGLAVMIFKILMFGRHPYSGVGAPPEIEKAIKQGYFCYGKYSKGTTPIYSKLFSEGLSNDVKTLFEQAFSKTQNGERPTADEWINALENLEQGLIQCSSHHKYYNNGNSCIWCKLSKLGFKPFGNLTVNNKQHNTQNYQQTPYTYQTPKKKKQNPAPAPPLVTNKNYQQPQISKPIPITSTNLPMDLKPIIITAGLLLFFLLVGLISSFNDSNNNEYPSYETQEEQPVQTQENGSENAETNPQTFEEPSNNIQPDENMKEQNSNENIHAQQNSSNTNIQTTSLNNEDNISKTQVNKLQPKVQNTTQKTKNATQSLNKTSTTPKATVPKPENKPKPKTDLEESTDYFFE